MNQNLPLPKYHQIYLVLCEKLQEGKFDSGFGDTCSFANLVLASLNPVTNFLP